ncbi:MAG TPA: glycosyltransferase family 4 protein [Herpetosiphonaceae bacterium]
MKIGFVLDDHLHRPGGVQEYVRDLYRYLERQGHQAVIFCGGSQFENIFSERVIQIGTALPVKGSGSSSSIPIAFQPPWELRRLLRSENCDVLHVQAPFSPTLSGRLLAHSDAAHVLSFHIRIDDALRLRLLGALARLQILSLRRIHARIAVSPAARETAEALYAGGGYEIIGVGVDVAPFRAAQRLPRLPRYDDGRVTLMAVGRLEERKGLDRLLRAYARLEREHGDALRLVIAGDGPERERLRQLERDLGLRTVEWPGYVEREQLPHLMRSADVFCAPALAQESFGKVLVEAMAAGLPIAAFANAGYAGVLGEHPGNLLAPVGDERALAGAIGAFVASKAMRQQVGRRNHQAAEQYSWDALGPRVLRVYEQAIERKRAGR